MGHQRMNVNQYQYWVRVPFSPWHQSAAGKGGACFKAQRAERWIKPKIRWGKRSIIHLYEVGFFCYHKRSGILNMSVSDRCMLRVLDDFVVSGLVCGFASIQREEVRLTLWGAMGSKEAHTSESKTGEWWEDVQTTCGSWWCSQERMGARTNETSRGTSVTSRGKTKMRSSQDQGTVAIQQRGNRDVRIFKLIWTHTSITNQKGDSFFQSRIQTLDT